MIERKFVSQKFKQFHIRQYLKHELNRVGLCDVKLQRTSMGEKIIIAANRPGLVVGRGGSVIQRLTKVMADKFKLENPQIEILQSPAPATPELFAPDHNHAVCAY